MLTLSGHAGSAGRRRQLTAASPTIAVRGAILTLAVTSPDVEIVKRAAEAYERRDVQGVLEFLDPDVELYPARAVMQGEPYRGHEGFERFLADMSEDWEDFQAGGEEYRLLDDGRVLVLGRFRARGKSGVELDSPAAWTCEVQNGRIVRLRFYADADAAVRAAE
jgi:ketosteroid isomerase-like protein